MCHERKRKLAVQYQRWELASRGRLAGVGLKPPSAAASKIRGDGQHRTTWTGTMSHASALCTVLPDIVSFILKKSVEFNSAKNIQHKLDKVFPIIACI